MPDVPAFSPPSIEELEVLSAAACEADKAGELRSDQLTLLHGHHWFKMLAPRAFGGAELALPEAVRLEESVSAADGSCGWVLTLCAGAGWFAGFLPERLAYGILSTPRVCLAGSGSPTGVAQQDGEGWLVSGRWAHATGTQAATHFTFNAQLHDGGLPVLDAAGRPRVRAFVVPADQVVVEPGSWHSIGLRATSSRAFAVDRVRTSVEQAFDIAAAGATAGGPLYRFPFRALALATLAACMAGMGRHFATLAKPLAARPIAHLHGPSSHAKAAWHEGQQGLARLRAVFYAELDDAWMQMQRLDALDAASEHRLGEAAHALARQAREMVDTLYPFCGLMAADARSDINRVWRDIHTASQHALWLRE